MKAWQACWRICEGAIFFVDRYKIELDNAEKQLRHNWCCWCSREKNKIFGAVKKARWRGKFYIHCFATFKKIVKKIEKDENESGAQMHQGEKIKCYTQEESI